MWAVDEVQSKRIEYATHNFSLLNRHTEEAVRRVEQLRASRGAEIFRLYCVYGSIVIAALAVLGLFAGRAYWLAFAPARPEARIIEVEKPIIVKEQVLVPTPAPVTTSDSSDAEVARLRRQIEQMSARQSAGSTAQPEKVVHNFTLFTTINYGIDGISSIVTGARFENSQSSYPEYQYCYVDLPLRDDVRSTSSASKIVVIANKNGRASVNAFVIDRTIAEAAGTTIGVLRNAQSKCRFI